MNIFINDCKLTAPLYFIFGEKLTLEQTNIEASNVKLFSEIKDDLRVQLFLFFQRCEDSGNFDVWTDDNQYAVTLGFVDLGCRAQPVDSLETERSCGPENQGTIINIG